jgi:hypothetical protein
MLFTLLNLAAVREPSVNPEVEADPAYTTAVVEEAVRVLIVLRTET